MFASSILRDLVDKLGFVESVKIFSTSFPVTMLEMDSIPIDMSQMRELARKAIYRTFFSGLAESFCRVGGSVGPQELLSDDCG